MLRHMLIASLVKFLPVCNNNMAYMRRHVTNNVLEILDVAISSTLILTNNDIFYGADMRSVYICATTHKTEHI